jgi:transmembrane sensor
MDNNKVNDLIRRYFSEKHTEKYRELIQLWLTMGDHKEEKDQSLRKEWDRLNCAETEADDEAWQSVHDRIISYESRHRVVLKIKRAMRYAAVLLLPVVSAFIAWHFTSSYDAKSYNMLECSTADGQMKTILLSDDTKVVLNGGSRIIYPEKFGSRGNRNVFVEGEAFFHVSHDSKHPFIANVENIDVKVLGTRFNIRAYRDEDNIITTLEEGSVLVSDGMQAIQLKPNQQAIYNRGKKIISRNIINADRESRWKEGDLLFDVKPLRMIISSISHKYGVKFEVDESINLNKVYTLNFKDTESIEDVINILNIVQNDNLRFRLKGNVVQVYKTRKEV